MSLELHHLHLSQSERVVWLLEELKVPYTLHVHDRDPKTGMAPQHIKDINPFGTAPYFRDTTVSPPVSLSESGAIVEYILTVYGGKTTPGSDVPRLTRTPDDKEYGDYLQWLHFANASLQPSFSMIMTFLLAGMSQDSPIVQVFSKRNATALKLLDERLAGSKFLAGEHLSAADIMNVCSLSTLRGFAPTVDLGPYPNILRYLKDVAERPAYLEALRKGDYGMEPMIQPKVKGFTQFESFKGALEKFNNQG
ncbi:glutathione S-transferase [Diaporthe helianthi]|uniref:Glutathione S-transferase n=1 Tax=Diaporthe helianthi TaxID=158607 RepID=A0A2P5I226_DIAHE|nr:glutathione S-transferase [Diaporthe helianthi]